MKLVLVEIGGEDFSTFPELLYTVRNKLSLKDRFQAFVPCPKCHKLYEKDKVENYLHSQVCSGAVSLREAQNEIATNWLAVYHQMPPQNQ